MKKAVALLLCLAMLLSMTGCFQFGDSTGILQQPIVPTEPVKDEETWSIYWYLCGSDLETNFGCATTDLSEMEAVELPENVNVIIQTGGAAQWENEKISDNKIQRWLYTGSEMTLLEELPSANMGEAETLTDFLTYGHTKYPADREAVIFWNHGGGTTGGVAYDEVYGYDSLSLKEIGQSFSDVWKDEKIELVGFDACLMATIDVAAALEPYANYMVASQELEPGIGWEYSGWLSDLAKKPGMNGAELGTAICDAYMEGCEENDCDEQVTQSVIDLNKVGPLLEAFEVFGEEALVEVSENPDFLAQMGRDAWSSENYGGNTPQSGYGNMVDLAHFAGKMEEVLPGAGDVVDALENCVVYKVAGEYRPESCGLSCYYSYSGNPIDFYVYVKQGTGTSIKYVYAFGLAREFLIGAMGFLGDIGIIDLPDTETVYTMGWDDHPIYVDDDACVVLDLGPEASSVLTNINFRLLYLQEELEYVVDLGMDNDMMVDMENGIFRDNFRGVWGAIDDHVVYMELYQSAEDYNLYAVPIELDGEEYLLQVAYRFDTEKWEILGASQGLDSSGMGGKNLRKLKAGDEITTLWSIWYTEEEEDFQWYEMETFTVTDDTSFGETDLGDGYFAIMYQMYDSSGNIAQSEMGYFECDGDTIYTYDEFPG